LLLQLSLVVQITALAPQFCRNDPKSNDPRGCPGLGSSSEPSVQEFDSWSSLCAAPDFASCCDIDSVCVIGRGTSAVTVRLSASENITTGIVNIVSEGQLIFEEVPGTRAVFNVTARSIIIESGGLFQAGNETGWCLSIVVPSN
jgi:hypothetical protein